MKMNQLRKHFEILPRNPTLDDLDFHAQAYSLRIIEGVLMLKKGIIQGRYNEELGLGCVPFDFTIMEVMAKTTDYPTDTIIVKSKADI
ncbi:hypothetical protein J1N35_021899 [Gossypium stocksii]|uniref:Uncharacterized protein n=1 Tax=Gossypium stocksii TaxID=47602 RepID=A0A9D3VFL1_9ROSI|nr:hypothetical protein J1N35_021899 [Gossypium stocksii]